MKLSVTMPEITPKVVTGIVMAVVFPSLCAAAPPSRSLSLEERVAAQRAIEEVYWSHRIWPKENPRPKPPLPVVLPDAAIRARVDDTLRKSNALEKFWHRPITPEQLQVEMNRMAAQTRDPQVLHELFAALGNDPQRIAETLVRQTLADGLIRSWYASDEPLHGAAAMTWPKVPFDAWWRKERGSLETVVAGPSDFTLPAISSSSCPDDTWGSISNVFNVPAARRDAVEVWTGTEMIVWGGSDGTALNTGGRYSPSTDTWTPTSTGANVPTARLSTGIWTGTEMIVWGGFDGGAYLNTGGRYNPTTDTWSPTSTAVDVPAGRSCPAVWTGTQMIVWGGFDGTENYLETGGLYDPAHDSWMPTSTVNAPEGRIGQSVVWSGTEVIVWGGYDAGTFLNTGGRYNPSTDTWTSTSLGMNVPIGRERHTAVWTGTEMIVWGGRGVASYGDLGYLASGGRYDPSTDAWTPTNVLNPPAPRDLHSAVWTGSEMIVWGGSLESVYFDCCDTWCDTICGWTTSSALADGSRYDPVTDHWRDTSFGPWGALPRAEHSAVWTGNRMLIWGGATWQSHGDAALLNDGGSYCACPNGTLYYRDVDGDDYGDAAVVGTSCDGTIPPGYVADSSDCNDGNASVHPGTLESCNAVDDDCNGTVDDASAPGPLAALTLRSDAPVIDWTPLPTAQSYDVVYGDIATLRSSGGDFTAATRGCIAAGAASTTTTFITAPAVGEAFWIVARGDNCAGAGTYDSGAPSQAGSRDAGIDASPYSCGYQAVCGDGSCSATEGCTDCPSDCGACQCTTDSECQPASCCNPTSCIPIWEPQYCDNPTCGDGCWICLTACQCQSGACVAVF